MTGNASFNAFTTPLELNLRPSKTVRRFVLCAHAVVFFLLLAATYPNILLRLAFCSAGLLSAVVFLWRQIKQPALPRLLLDRDGKWSVLQQGAYQAAELLPATVIRPFGIFLQFKLTQSGQKFSVPVFPDSVSPELYRRLQARLNIGA